MISNTATNWPLSSVSLCSLTFNFSRRKNRILSEFDEVINTTSSQWRSSISNFPATRNFDKCSSIQNTMYGRSKILWQKNPNSKLLNYKLQTEKQSLRSLKGTNIPNNQIIALTRPASAFNFILNKIWNLPKTEWIFWSPFFV